MARWWCWGKKGGTQEFNFFTVCHERVNIFAIWLLNKPLIDIQTIWISQEWIRHIRQTHPDMFVIARLNILSIMPWTWLFRHKNYSRCVKGLGVITVTVRSRDLACVESHQEALRVLLQKKKGFIYWQQFQSVVSFCKIFETVVYYTVKFSVFTGIYMHFLSFCCFALGKLINQIEKGK